ncbi:MAG: DUF2280 domain-containing protein [Capsulimonadaceae bacterium]|nr:DUF2280 domain-containing protein [Capsulimonadaceae bacterium]
MKLSSEVRRSIIEMLACYATPSEVQVEVRKAFGVECSLPQILRYDPTTLTGKTLSAENKALFNSIRNSFVAGVSSIAISQKSVRLRRLERDYVNAQSPCVRLRVLEQAAKEVGGMFRRGRR